jgi:hypothetical protein
MIVLGGNRSTTLMAMMHNDIIHAPKNNGAVRLDRGPEDYLMTQLIGLGTSTQSRAR